MKRIDIYCIREFLKPLIFATLAFGLLVVISEFFRNLSFYMEQKTSLIEVAKFLSLNFPWWSLQVLPVSVLLAVLFSVGQLSRHGEIIALKSAGVNLWRIIFIFVGIGIVIGAIDLGLREWVIPVTSRAADKILMEKIHHERPKSRVEFKNLVVSLPPNARMTIGYLNTEKDFLDKIVIDYYSDKLSLLSQTVAEHAQYSDGSWILSNGVERNFTDGILKERYFDESPLQIYLTPDDFVLDDIRPEQKSTEYFKNNIQKLGALGIPTQREKLQYYLRWASAFSHVIVMLIGIPFALQISRRHGKIVSFIFALLFAFFYWGIQAVGQSFGDNNVISPFVAAWIGNAIFGSIGIFMIARLRK